MSTMNRFSIRDIENLTGIKAHTLRIWEQRHGLLIPKRTDTNIRYYDGEDLKMALKISLLNHHGYKISRIQRMDNEQIDTLLRETADVGFQFDYLLNNMMEATIDMDSDKLENLLDKYIRKFGIEQTVEQLIFAFMVKIGIMWMSNRVIPAQEHIASNIISRKILLAIEKLPRKMDFTQPKFLLFLPEGEIHEIGLLYVQYHLLKHGKNTIYLGPNAPLSQVELVCKLQKPNYLYTHVTAVSNDFDLENYFTKLSKIFPLNKIFASGSMLQKGKLPQDLLNVVFLTTLREAKAVLANTK